MMKPGTYYYSWETRGDAGVGTSLIDSDQMGVPTRCCTATENSSTPSRCIPQEHIVHFVAEAERDPPVPYEESLQSSVLYPRCWPDTYQQILEEGI